MAGLYSPTDLLQNRSYVSLSGLEVSLSSSVTSSATSLTASRLSVSNLLNTDIIFPIKQYNLNQHTYWGSGYYKTKEALANIVDNYPIGISASTTSTLYLEDIERATNFINGLDDYSFWVLRQLCGATLTADTLSFTATATAIVQASSATITSNSPTIVVPVINRDINNYLIYPQGPGDAITLDSYYTSLQDDDPVDTSSNLSTLTNYEQILATAIMFDKGMRYALENYSATAGPTYSFHTYNGLLQTNTPPVVFEVGVNRSDQLENLTPGVLFQDDDQNILSRLLATMGHMFDEVKVYIDGLKTLFKNYWANWDNLPQGYIQQLIAYQYGIELFSSENRRIQDQLELRGSYKSQKEATFEFWNRILCSLSYILKTKGSVEAIKASARAYGITSSILQVYELASYKASINAYYNDVRNYAIGEFRYSSTAGQKYFTSVSAVTSGSYTSVMVAMRIKFEDLVTYGATYGYSGTIWTLNPNLKLSYDYRYDQDNISTSGFPYINFTLSCSGQSLTTGYNFLSQALSLSEDKYWNLFFGRDGSTLYGRLGFIPSNTDYFDPIITSVTSSVVSLSAASLSYSSISIGDTTRLDADISNFYVQKVGYSDNQIRDYILDPTYLSVIGGYDNNILNWRLNEYVDFSSTASNYILDSGPSGITGSPSFVGTNGIPYDYAYDSSAFYNDDIPGFKLQKSEWNNSVSAVEDVIKEKGMRVGISIARPMEDFMHTMFGSGFGQLFADTDFIFSSTAESQAYYTWELAETQVTNIFSAIGSSRNSVQISEYLKFLNRINGHLGSFFQFLDQVIPASKRLVERGIIIENPFYYRTILKKSNLKIQGTFNPLMSVSGDPEVVLENVVLPPLALTANPTFDIFRSNVYGTTLSYAPNLSLDYTILSGNGSTSPTMGLTASYTGNGAVINSVNGSVTGSISGGLDDNLNYDGDIRVRISETITSAPTKFFEYIPRVLLKPYTITYFSNASSDSGNNYNKRIAPQNIGVSSFFMNIVINTENRLLSTSLTAADSDKRIQGIIYIVDQTGRKISTDYDAVQVDMSECLSGGLNRVRVIMDGQDIPFTTHLQSFKISEPTGINFEINVSGAPNDGNSTNTITNVLFNNLLNSSENGKAVKIVLADSMEQFTLDTGMGFTQGS